MKSMKAVALQKCQPGLPTDPNVSVVFCNDVRRADGEDVFGEKNTHFAVIQYSNLLPPSQPNPV